ncbi:hypothetical protein HK104_002645 [Borealophlyctis nickersoniae]|nr:hypothetical protein HK104_002645 [Borealophlyctis nickersoniae]
MASRKRTRQHIEAEEEEAPEKTETSPHSTDADDAGSEVDDEATVTQPTPSSSKLAAQLARLEKLKSLRSQAQKLNHNEVKSEHRRSKDNPREAIRNEKKKKEAETLLVKQTADLAGQDYERLRSMEYTAEAVERYEKKQREKEKRIASGFTDYAQVAAKKYKKQIKDFKPNLALYAEKRAEETAVAVTGRVAGESSFYRGADSLAYAGTDSKPTRVAVERVIKDLDKQQEKREQFSRRRAYNEDDDVYVSYFVEIKLLIGLTGSASSSTYINERNMRFNKKIGRAYDKYTVEIKANFERGTAL